MVRISFSYACTDGSFFDAAYYVGNHLPLVLRKLKPYGIVKAEVDLSSSGEGGDVAERFDKHYHAIGYLYFDAADDFVRGFEQEGAELKANIPNYTNITPVVQMSEVTEVGHSPVQESD